MINGNATTMFWSAQTSRYPIRSVASGAIAASCQQSECNPN